MADSNNSGENSAVTAIVAILVIIVIGLAVYFGIFRERGVNNPSSNINVTVPAGSGLPGGATR